MKKLLLLCLGMSFSAQSMIVTNRQCAVHGPSRTREECNLSGTFKISFDEKKVYIYKNGKLAETIDRTPGRVERLHKKSGSAIETVCIDIF